MILLLLAAGCKKGPPENQQEAQKKIQELEAKVAQAEKQPSVAAPLEKSETPDLSLDLITAAQLLQKANEAVDGKDVNTATGQLARAGECLRGAMYALPREQMAARLERALTLLDRAELSPASRELELARQTDFEANPPSLGPDVEDQLVAVRKKIEQGDPAGARQDILGLLDLVRKDEAAALFERAIASVEAAASALGRQGYTAAQGEIAEARKSIADLEAKLQPTAAAPPKAAAPAASPAATAPAPTAQPTGEQAGTVPTEPTKPPAQPAGQ